MKPLATFTAIALGIVSTFSGATFSMESALTPHNNDQSSLQRQQAIDDARAPIKSERDLQKYLATEPETSPLRHLTNDARQRFLGSLMFSDKGLATYAATDLQEQLSASQVYDVLSLFGVQGGASLLKKARIDTPADAIILGDVHPDVLCIPDEVFGCAPGTGGGSGGSGGGSGGGDHPHYRCEAPQSHNCVHTVEDVICTHNC